jgi:hypothetical protein
LHFSGLSTPVRDVSGGADNVLGGAKTMILKLTAFVVATAVVALADISVSACDNIPGNLVKNCGFEIVVGNPSGLTNAVTDWYC